MDIRSYLTKLNLVFLACMLSSGCTLSHHQYKEHVLLKGTQVECDPASGKISKAYLFSESECTTYKEKLARDSYTASDYPFGGYTFGVVEFDDFGEYWAREQLTDLKNRLSKIAEDRPVVFILFIHGWRHNAGEASSNLSEFRKLIQKLGSEKCLDVWRENGQACKKAGKGEKAPHVAGVYISWRGDPLALNYQGKENKFKEAIRSLQMLSVWNRKRAARFVAGTNATHTILSLMQTIEEGDLIRQDKLKTYSDRQTFIDSKKYLIGHSFGARFLESAMAQSFLGRKHLASQLGLSGVIKGMQTKLNSANNELKSLRGLFEDLNDEEQNLAQTITTTKTLRDTAQIEKLDEEKNQKIFETRKNSFLEISDDSKGAVYIIDVYESAIEELEKFHATFADLSAGIFSFNNSYLDSIKRSDGSVKLPLSERPKFCSVTEKKLQEARYCELLEEVRTLNDSFKSQIAKLTTMVNKQYLNNAELEGIKTQIGNLEGNDDIFYESIKTRWAALNKTLNADYEIADDYRPFLKNLKNIFDPIYDSEFFGSKPETHRLLDGAISYEDRSPKLISKSKTYNDLKNQALTLAKDRDAILKIMKNFDDFEDGRLGEIREDMQFLDRLASKALFPPADLAIMVNPATEALNAQMLINSMCEDEKYRDMVEKFDIPRRPWLISIKSDADDATGKWFGLVAKIAAYLPTRPGTRKYKNSQETQTYSDEIECTPLRASSQKELISKTAPNIEAFRTHELTGPEVLTKKVNSPNIISGIYNGYRENLDPEFVDQDTLFTFKHQGERYNLVEKANDESRALLKYSDYWSFTVPKTIISDHNDIFQDGFGKLLGGLIWQQNRPICREHQELTAETCGSRWEAVDKNLNLPEPKNTSYCVLKELHSCLEIKVDSLIADAVSP